MVCVEHARTSLAAKRNRPIAEYLNGPGLKKPQLGTSNNVLEGWLNTDIDLYHDPVVYLDATKRFPFDDNTFDYIASEHMIEHVEYEAAQVMLQECFRVLKPGGRVRIATPDPDRSSRDTPGKKRAFKNSTSTGLANDLFRAPENAKTSL